MRRPAAIHRVVADRADLLARGDFLTGCQHRQRLAREMPVERPEGRADRAGAVFEYDGRAVIIGQRIVDDAQHLAGQRRV